MSVVACRIVNDGFEMSSNSITVRGSTQSKGKSTTHHKLFEVNNMVIGGVGTAEENSLMRLFAENRGLSVSTDYAVLEFMSDFLDWKRKKTDAKVLDNTFLIGFSGKVFSVENWFIEEVKTYEAIGAGMDFALATLYAGHSTEEAVRAAIELSIYCEEPIITIKKYT